MKRIAIIGCGALAQVFAKHYESALSDKVALLGFYSRHVERTQSVARLYGVKSYGTFEEMLEDKPELIIEFASKEAVQEYAERVLTLGIDFVAVSVGALVDVTLFKRLEQEAKKTHAHLYVPSGAIGGFDILQVFGLMGQADVSIESVKGPKSLEGAKGLQGRTLSRETREMVFEGNVSDAIAGFPKNVNVAVATSLASMTPTTTVRVVSDPTTQVNTHTIEARNATMHATLQFASSPDPANPKSSISTAWSVIALLKQITSPVCFF